MAGYLAGLSQMFYMAKYLALGEPYIWPVSQIAYKLFDQLPVKYPVPNSKTVKLQLPVLLAPKERIKNNKDEKKIV